VLLQGCISLQLPGADGRPRLIGVGKTSSMPVKGGEIYEVVAPGLSLRLHRYATGLSLGEDRLRLFIPTPEITPEESVPQTDQPPTTKTAPTPLGFWQQTTGFEIGPKRLMLGHRQALIIPMPQDRHGGTQWLIYSAAHPEKTQIGRKEGL
jgi:hypothetical protein